MTVLITLKEMMHAVSSGLLLPAIAVLLFMLALSVVELGGLLVEAVTERRKMKVGYTRVDKWVSGKGCCRNHAAS